MGGRRVVVVVALLGPLGVASTAHADATDDAFLKALRDKGISYVSPDSAISAGHKVCQLLDTGQTYTDVAEEVLKSSTLDAYHAGYFVGVSMAAYCPHELR
nr:DUF732 domain-containing protein [Mycobacterium sp. E2733]